MPMVLCDGCGASTKRSGIVQHCRLSRNPACHTSLKDLLETANEGQVRAESPESLEAYMQGNDEIGTETMFFQVLY
jgi:hypothetical protein